LRIESNRNREIAIRNPQFKYAAFTMKVLVVGSGGREDALAWRLSKDPEVETVATCPGNVGSARWGRNIETDPETAAATFRPDLIVIGPETPLADGLADRLRAAGFRVFGPGAFGARIEASKVWSKQLMVRHGIPTARAEICENLERAANVLASRKTFPVVVKADGLAAGKGVTVARDAQEARAALSEIFLEKRFGAAGRKVVIEEFLVGRETSILALTDGERLHILPAAEDHKAVFDGDTGPNTGGMGAVAPTPVVDAAVLEKVEERILRPLLEALKIEAAAENVTGDAAAYRGVIFAGLMVSPSGDPFVVEFNCRFGDPETQVVLPLVNGSLAYAMKTAAEGRMDAATLGVRPGSAACVILASGGYPGAFEKGKAISGWSPDDGLPDGQQVFVSGAERQNGSIVTSGGRVVAAVGIDRDLDAALAKANALARGISFEGVHFRTDIGRRVS
jgi:phosphoribosylamine--glycine ligase